MEYSSNAIIDFYDLYVDNSSFGKDIIEGLTKAKKEVRAKYFYDEQGSRLFSSICKLEEYYLTRTEITILQDASGALSDLIGENAMVIEYGSGDLTKIRILLAALRDPSIYMPIDISKEYLLANVKQLIADYPHITIISICADYLTLKALPQQPANLAVAKRVIFFPGSTIGNLSRYEAHLLLQRCARLLQPGDAMIIGVDLAKDSRVLHSAYNDSQNITAQFNLNLLTRINRELSANFDLDSFGHTAFYNENEGRVEMHLVSLREQTVTIGDTKIYFRKGETIHTENSYKYSAEEFRYLARSAGFTAIACWIDKNRLFSVHCLTL